MKKILLVTLSLTSISMFAVWPWSKTSPAKPDSKNLKQAKQDDDFERVEQEENEDYNQLPADSTILQKTQQLSKKYHDLALKYSKLAHNSSFLNSQKKFYQEEIDRYSKLSFKYEQLAYNLSNDTPLSDNGIFNPTKKDLLPSRYSNDKTLNTNIDNYKIFDNDKYNFRSKDLDLPKNDSDIEKIATDHMESIANVLQNQAKTHTEKAKESTIKPETEYHTEMAKKYTTAADNALSSIKDPIKFENLKEQIKDRIRTINANKATLKRHDEIMAKEIEAEKQAKKRRELEDQKQKEEENKALERRMAADLEYYSST